MILGPEVAAKITQQLSTEEAEAISFEIARMERVSSEVAEAVLIEWVETLRAANTLTDGGGVEYAREILERAFGAQKAGAILRRIQSQWAIPSRCTGCATPTRSSSATACAASTRRPSR